MLSKDSAWCLWYSNKQLIALFNRLKNSINLEESFPYLQLKFLLEKYTQNRNMKKNVGFTAMLFL